MKKLVALLVALSMLCLGCIAGADGAEKDEWTDWFEAVVGTREAVYEADPYYWDDVLVLSIPRDWSREEAQNGQAAFTGTDESGNSASVALRIEDSKGMSWEDFASGEWDSKAAYKITKGDFTFYAVLEGEQIYFAWLLEAVDRIFTIRASLDAPEGIHSAKLARDLHLILCEPRLVYDGEIEERDARSALPEGTLSDADRVVFQDAGLERMLREALGKAEGEGIYAPELEPISRLTMRFGIARFDEEVLQSVEGYSQEEPLDLSDLRWLPNLEFLSVTDMTCTGFESLEALAKLKRLTLINAGVTDCGIAANLSLESLSLARNDIESFDALASMTDLKSLNLYMTGLDSLEVVRDLTNLELLVVGDEPISDLEPVAGLTKLKYLGIAGTKVRSLEAIRDLMQLETLDISNLVGEISLEPLYEHDHIARIIARDTSLSDADRERFGDVL